MKHGEHATDEGSLYALGDSRVLQNCANKRGSLIWFGEMTDSTYENQMPAVNSKIISCAIFGVSGSLCVNR